MIRTYLDQVRLAFYTDGQVVLDACLATRGEFAPVRQVDTITNHPGNDVEPFLGLVQDWDGFDQTVRIRMQWLFK